MTARQLSLLLIGLMTLLLNGGCQPDVRRPERHGGVANGTTALTSQADTHFEMAWTLLERLEVGIFAGQQTRARIGYDLEEWSKRQEVDPNWSVDPIVERFPPRFNRQMLRRTLTSLNFHLSDVTYLTEAIMMRDVAEQAVAGPLLDQQLRAQLHVQLRDLEPDAADQLLRATKLFDWTIRNIQLESLDEEPPSAAPSEAPPRPRPGGRRFAWQALLVGRGDAHARARVFLLLARQQRIPVVMLAVEDEPAPRPWVPAAWIGGQLYLFDTQLGLPLPGPDGSAVTTLSQLRASPELLDQVRLADGPPYGFAADELRRLIALLDAPAEALSQRMALAEAAATGDHKVILTTQPTPLADQLQETQLVLRSQLWTQPYDAEEYYMAASRHPETRRALWDQLQPLEGDQPLAIARRLHLRGQYSNDPPRLGARAWYLRARPSDRELNRMESLSDEQLQAEVVAALKLPPEVTENPEIVRQLVLIAREQAVASKETASYWLGIIAFEHEQFDVAADFFQTRTLEAYPEGRWLPGATYHLARTYEWLGLRDNDPTQLTRAIELYRKYRDGPQTLGNLLRAERLASQVESVASPPPGTAPST